VSLPTGTVSLLFTDVEGSTRLLHALGADYDAVMETHLDILCTAIDHHRGAVFGSEGDAVFAVFAEAEDALAAAEEAQRELTAKVWPALGALRVRMAVHTGEVRLARGTYYGMSLHETARVCAAAHGGQVLLTGATCAASPGVRVRDLGEHRLRDLRQPVALKQLLADGLVVSFPPVRTLTALPNNLPAGADEFVGRTAELASAEDALAHHRLVTLTGAGGSGKTRLALEVAGGMLGSVHDGAWFVELAPLTDPTLITAQIAAALGLGERAGTPLEQTLVDWLGPRDVLLVLDNCEHLVDGVAQTADHLLRACPTLRILVTSREAVGIKGEFAMRVPPLSLDGEAAQLLLTRADTLVPGFQRDTADRDTVDSVCRRLDGLPLGIELAAVRLRSLSLQELSERLDDRFRLLTGGSRTAPTRQRTLEAMVDWSYDLLNESDRELFRELSVFPDSFTAAAAAAVGDLDDLEALDGVARLVEKSLVVPVETRSGGSRFGLLETLRQYGRDRLHDLGDEARLRDRLLAWAMVHVQHLERDMRTPAMDAALAAVMPERVNMRAAMDWAIERGDLVDALRLVTNVPLALTTQRRELIVDLLERGGASLPPDVVACAQMTMSDLAFEQGDWAAAAEYGGLARTGFEVLGDRHRSAWARHDESSGFWGTGDVAELDRLLPGLLQEFRDLGDEYGIAQTVWRSSLREPDRVIATQMADEAEQSYRVLGSPIMRAHALEARALIDLDAEDLPGAAPFLREALSILASSNNMGCTAHILEAVAAWAAAGGHLDDAGELIGAAESLRSASGAGHKPWEVRARHGRDFDASVLGDPDAASDSVARGRQLSLASAAALADGLLSQAG